MYNLSREHYEFVNVKVTNQSPVELHFSRSRGCSSVGVGPEYSYGQRQARLFIASTLFESMAPPGRCVYDAADAGASSQNQVADVRLFQKTKLRRNKPVYKAPTFDERALDLPPHSPFRNEPPHEFGPYSST